MKNDPLHHLRQQVARKKQLEPIVADLRQQQTQLSQHAKELERILRAEQADVDRLEGRSLAALFYEFLGNKGEKLDAERREAYAARAKYDLAVRELASVEAQLQATQAELAGLQGIEDQYEQALREKTAALKAADGTDAENILKIEERIAFLHAQKAELQEAIAAGQKADRTAQQALASLDSAEGWGTYDLLGGGMIASLAKHSKLDDAQYAVELMQRQLRQFKTELADVSIQADLDIRVDEFLHFADCFFDSWFADMAVLEKIDTFRKQIQAVQKQIANALDRLQALQERAEKEIDRRSQNLNDYILKA